MPTIDNNGPFKVVIYPADHEPAHVHIRTSQGEIVINLVGEGGEPEIREFYGPIGKRVIRQALALTSSKQKQYMAEWLKMHGDD